MARSAWRVSHNGWVNATVDPDLEYADPAEGAARSGAEKPVDEKLAAAVDIARAAAQELGQESVGEHLGVARVEKRVATHAFAAQVPGYTGWYWAVTVVRARKQTKVTVDEVVLLPGAEALLAPAWVPWSERVKPGDLSPGELLPPRENDPRLVPAYVQSDDPAVEAVAFELGVGRERVMSREGRLETAERWHDGPHGPATPMAKQAPAPCGTCGFLLPLAGSLSAGFGVCGNELTDTDGQVVSVEYGCGAHSQVELTVPSAAEPSGDVYDDGPAIEPGSLGEPRESDDDAGTEELGAIEPAEVADAVESAPEVASADGAAADETVDASSTEGVTTLVAAPAESDGSPDSAPIETAEQIGAIEPGELVETVEAAEAVEVSEAVEPAAAVEPATAVEVVEAVEVAAPETDDESKDA